MNFNAIICEYNPFHNGHKYHIERVKTENNAPTAAIMSGSFTQRGDVSVTDKFTKAKTAVENGADLVVELPTVYALGSARTFARGGVGIAEAMGCVKNLCFSAENADKELLTETARAFEDKKFKAELKNNMQSGDYYPQAVEKAMRKVFSDRHANIVSEPNNILAVEYIRESKTLDFIVTKRMGAAHDSTGGSSSIKSASELRQILRSGKDISPFSPSKLSETADVKRLDRIILYKLRTMTQSELRLLPDVSEGLENRIAEAVKSSVSVAEILEKVKTKRYTMARLRRILLCALLGITDEMGKCTPPYIRVLAFNARGAEMLGEIKKSSSIPLITNVADGYKSLGDSAKRIFDIDILATDVLALAFKNPKPCKLDFTRGVIVIK